MKKIILKNNYEEQVKKWIDEAYECVPKYEKVYNWWCQNKIKTDTWFDFCKQCLFEIEMMIGGVELK